MLRAPPQRLKSLQNQWPRSSAVKTGAANQAAGHAANPAIKAFRQIRGFPGGAIEHHQTPAIALIPSPHLRPECEHFPIGRIQGNIIRAEANGDLVDLSANDGDGINIRIGAGGRIDRRSW
jgi:hypothetical protein